MTRTATTICGILTSVLIAATISIAAEVLTDGADAYDAEVIGTLGLSHDF